MTVIGRRTVGSFVTSIVTDCTSPEGLSSVSAEAV